MEAQSEVHYVHTTLYSVKVTRYLQVCLTCNRKWQNLDTLFSADFPKTRTNQISENPIALSFSFLRLIRTHALKIVLKNGQCKFYTAQFEHNIENCTLLLSLVNSPMVNSTYLVARCNSIPFLVNLFQLFQAHYMEKSCTGQKGSICGLPELPWVSHLFIRSLNPLNAKSDQHQLSPCNINAL